MLTYVLSKQSVCRKGKFISVPRKCIQNPQLMNLKFGFILVYTRYICMQMRLPLRSKSMSFSIEWRPPQGVLLIFLWSMLLRSILRHGICTFKISATAICHIHKNDNFPAAPGLTKMSSDAMVFDIIQNWSVTNGRIPMNYTELVMFFNIGGNKVMYKTCRPMDIGLLCCKFYKFDTRKNVLSSC